MSELRPWPSLALWFALAAGLTIVASWLVATFDGAPAAFLFYLPTLAVVVGIARTIGRRTHG